MRFHNHVLLTSFLLVSFLCCSLAKAQEVKPTPEHDKLKAMAGKWKFVLKMPDGTESPGTNEAKMECGGLWLITDFKTTFGGAPFQGRGMDGYDPDTKKYVGVWVDSFSTAPMTFEGNYDSTGKVLTMTSNALGPDRKPAKWRSISKFASPDEYTFEMLVTMSGSDKESSMMVVHYKRDK